MANRRILTRALARSFLAGEPTLEGIVERGARTLGMRWRWLGPLAARYVAAYAGITRPRLRDVTRFLARDAGFNRAWARHARLLTVEELLDEPPHMQPVAAAEGWPIPAIVSAGDLAAWFEIMPADLDWFADLQGLNHRDHRDRLQHYHYRILRKRSGGLRAIEVPKPHLKQMQRRILEEILNPIPAHPAVHGFRKGRSIRTFVAPHAGKHVVLRMDLRDFFPSFGAARIQAFFRTMGYPETVADLLGGICTNVVPRWAWKQSGLAMDAAELREARELYSRPHLPQGAPTSPALANFCTLRADRRLAGLARSAGAEYTRYADDVAFSGGEEFARCVERFATHAAAILLEEGFQVQHRKTRIMRQGARQHLAGLVANQRPNIRREEFDRLKATLTNCVRHGPATQNRAGVADFRKHLEGRIAFVKMINAAKAERLSEIFARIEWP